MSATIIDGKEAARQVRAGIRSRVESLLAGGSGRPGLHVVLVGDDPASQVYVRNKGRAAEECGFASETHRLDAGAGQSRLLGLIGELNAEAAVHGILVQLPLPAGRGYDEKEVIDRIDPAKDVDGLHPVNQGRLLAGTPGLRPCTPAGVMRLIESTGETFRGRRAVVVGRSLLVGKPAALMLLERHCTVTLCHSRTADLPAEIGSAEILVAAIGRPEMIHGGWIRPGAVVIDVGMNRLPDGRLCGDVAFPAASERAGYLTPVPGGVGPMTIAMLLANTLTAFESRRFPD